jgi:hypothetical protein
MTESRARRDLDVDYLLDDHDEQGGWFGQAQAEPAPMHEVDDLYRDDPQENWEDDPDTDQWHMPTQAAGPAALETDDLPREDVDDDGWNTPRNSRWDGHYPPRVRGNGTPHIGEWTFTVSKPEPWYRSKHVKTGLIAAAAPAIAVPLFVLVVRSFGADAEESTTVPSQAPTSAEPVPTSSAPALSTARPSPPAPPPPPPPPPPADEPVIIRQYPQQRQSAPEQTDKPEIGVTRTPVTRAPISAKPPSPPTPGRNSGTPGDAGGDSGGWGPW